MERYSEKHYFREQPKAPSEVKQAQEESVWQGPVGIAGIEVDYEDAWDLWCASIDGHLPTIEHVLAKDARLANIVFRYTGPLDMAIYGGHLEAAQRLIDAGAELCFKYGARHWERMTQVAHDRGRDDIADLLLETVTQRFNYHPDIHLILDAYRAQDPDQLRRLLDEKPERIHVADMNGNTPLHWAAIAWQIPMCEVLVEYGADLNRENGAALVPHRIRHENTMGHDRGMREGLMWGEDFFATQRRLIEFGPDEDDILGDIRRADFDSVRARVRDTPECLHDFRGKQTAPLTAAVGNLEMVRLLLELGANPKIPEVTAPFGDALYTACCGGCVETIRLLLDAGADPHSYSDSSGDCYMAAASWGKNREQKVAMLNRYSGCEYLLLACRSDQPSTAELGASVREVLSQAEITDWQVMHLLEVITTLTDDIDLLNEYVERLGDRAIEEIGEFCVEDARASMTDRLRELQALHHPPLATIPLHPRGFVNTRLSPVGESSIHWEYQDRVEEFVAAGGDLDAVDHYDMVSALSRACADGELELAKRILSLGADPDSPPQDGYRPLDRAKAKGHDEIVKLLEVALEKR